MESEESPVMETAAANTTPAADNTTPAAGATVETATENPAEIVTDNPAEALNNANVGEVQTVAEGENLPTVEVVSEEAELAGEGKAEEELPCNSEGNLSLENSMDNEGSEMVMSQAKDRSEFYLPETLRPPQSVADLGRECLALHHVFGNDNSKRGNLHIIEDDVVVYATSSSVIFENLVSSSKRYLLGVDEGGVGCVAVHPSR